MAENSAISWTDDTFNPWIGCSKVSDGCKFCYAENTMDTRYKKVKWGPHGTRTLTSPENWRKPLKWNRQAEAAGERRRVFCASLADVFEDWQGEIQVNTGMIAGCDRGDGRRRDLTMDDLRLRLLSLIHQTPNLDWLLLTKRPENIERHLAIAMDNAYGVPQQHSEFAEWLEGWVTNLDVPHNVWLGTSCENQAEANRRIPHLLRTPAKVRFISAEPLLGPVDLQGKLIEWRRDGSSYFSPVPHSTCHQLIDWVIAGGESGHNARPMHPDWARALRDQCQDSGVSFHFKQWGEWIAGTKTPSDWERGASQFNPGCYYDFGDDYMALKVGKKTAGRLLDGREWNEFPDSIYIGTTARSA